MATKIYYVAPTTYYAATSFVPTATVAAAPLCCETATPAPAAAPARAPRASVETLPDRGTAGGTIESTVDEPVAPIEEMDPLQPLHEGVAAGRERLPHRTRHQIGKPDVGELDAG